MLDGLFNVGALDTGPPVDLGRVSIGSVFGGTGGVTGNRGIGQQAEQLVFNISIGSIDDQERLNQLVRQIQDIIRNNNRSGINISSQ